MCEYTQCNGRSSIDPLVCSGHGKCFEGICIDCEGYGGIDCNVATCLQNCSGNGNCVAFNNCICLANYSGQTCSDKVLYQYSRCKPGQYMAIYNNISITTSEVPREIEFQKTKIAVVSDSSIFVCTVFSKFNT